MSVSIGIRAVSARQNIDQNQKTMPSTDYIPQKLADFAIWIANFSALITAAPTDYGLVAGDATAIAAQNTAFQDAYAISSTPATRTSSTIAATTGARFSALAVVRPYAMRINANQTVSDEQRVDLGLTVRTVVPTPVPPPITAPVLNLRAAVPGQYTMDFRDAVNPDPKAKPTNVLSCEIVRAVGVAPAVDPAVLPTALVVTKSPFVLTFAPSDAGKVVTLFARWRNRSGPGGIAAAGPWSAQFTGTVI